ncbi:MULTISPECIES: hypothetical protein [Cohnella]|uniref:Exosporium protein C n=1 Tax=Cohnella phaseoli TaxID=456490 RepID=A0A3D9HUM2_9BACL|nr:hypothetical protein [Cohnella phaseoli]RED52586.1 hypothetical protein DFP98_15815 [Cohnella phaseoli]
MTTLFNYNATVVTPIAGGTNIAVPLTPAKTDIASVIVSVPNTVPRYVQIVATVGIQSNPGSGSVLYRIRRGGTEIYYSRIGIEASFTTFQLNSLLTIDGNSPSGPQIYTLSIESVTPGLTVAVIGPVEISATSFG